MTATKFYHQGASGPEELVLVPAGGMSTDALRSALQAMVDRWEPDADDGQDRIMWKNAVAALAAAQAGGAEWRVEWRKDEWGTDARAAYIGGLHVGHIMQSTTREHHYQEWRGWFMDSEDGNQTGWFSTADAARQSVEQKFADAIRALRPPAAPAESETDTVQFCRYCGAKTWFRNGVCEWFDNHKGDPRSALSVSAPAGAPSETVAVPRHWLKQVLESIQGELPRGHIGDVAFLMRGQIEDLLRQ